MIIKEKILVLFLLCFTKTYSQSTYTTQNIDVLLNIKGYSSSTTTPLYQQCKGWVDNKNKKEYAIYNCNEKTYFVDITKISEVRKVDSITITGLNDPVNIYIENNRLYLTISNIFTFIYSLNYFPDSIKYIGQSWDVEYNNCVIKNNNMFKYRNGKLIVYDISDPTTPIGIDTLENDISHLKGNKSFFIKNDTIYLPYGSKGLYIIDYKNHKFSIIDSLPHNFSNVVSNYAVAVSNNNKTLCTFYSPVTLDANFYYLKNNNSYSFERSKALTFTNHTVTPGFIDNDWLLISNSVEGLLVYDVTDLNDIKKTGYFNSYDITLPNKTGIESYYTGLPSGNILVLDKQQGLFVLDAKKAMTKIIVEPPSPQFNYSLSIFPNPCNESFSIQLKRDFESKLIIYDPSGKQIFQKDYSSTINDVIDTKDLKEGEYILKIEGKEGQLTQKIIVLH